MNKVLILLFASLHLFSFDYHFSLENNSINIDRNKKIDIIFSLQALKSDDGDFIDNKWAQEAVNIKENNASGKKILFTTNVVHGLYTTFSIYPKNMQSNFKYYIEVDGSKFKSQIGEFAIDKNISFTTANFLDILYLKEVNISLLSAQKISISLNKPPSADVDVEILSNNESISVSPSSITLSSLNYQNGLDITIRTDNKLMKDGNYSLSLKNTSLAIEKEIKLKVVNSKISLIANIQSRFSQEMTKSLSIHLNKPALSSYEVSISNTKSEITLSKNKLVFTRDNYNVAQSIIIDAKNITKDTNDTISLASRDMNKEFKIQPRVPIMENNSTQNPITILKTTSLFNKIKWEAKTGYNGLFLLYIGFTQDNINILIGEANSTNYMVMHQPNLDYFISVKYKDDLKIIGSIQTKGSKANLEDSDKDGLSNDLEELFDTATNTEDVNQDNIADVVQNYLLKLENKSGKSLYSYTLSSDIDNDKLGDILELSLGRDPLTSGFNGTGALELTVPADGSSVYVANFSELQSASSITVNHTASIEGYIGDGCLKDGILVANFLTKDDCKNIKQETFTSGNKTILWVAMDDFGNIAYKQQVLAVFRKSNDGNSSSTIIFTVDDINYTIKTTTGNSLSFGALSRSKTYTNPIVYEKDTLASDFKFTNNIFDLIIQSNGGTASVVIKQPITIEGNSQFRIFKNEKYHIFDTSQGDRVYSARGNGNQCNFNDNYKEFLKERDYCIKIDIKDGGLNDSDGSFNGSVSLIGGASVIHNIISINDNDSIGCSSLHASGLDGRKAKFDYLMVFSFLISFAYVIRMFARRKIK